MADADITLFPVPLPDSSQPWKLRLVVILGTIVIVALLALLLQARVGRVLLLGGAIAGIIAVRYALPYVIRHRDWLICCIALIFQINGFSFFGPAFRAVFHYGSLALFCIPVVVTSYNSQLFRGGGFRLYVIYFLWAAGTIAYSLAPEFSVARLGEAILMFAVLVTIVRDVDSSAAAVRLLARYATACGAVVAMVALSALVLPHDLTWVSPLASFTADQIREMEKQGISVAGVDRFCGVLSGPNDVGGLMLIFVGPAIVCWPSVGRRARFLLAVLLAVAIAMAALADSRSPFVALAIGGALYTVWRWRARGLLLVAVIGLAATGALVIYTHGDLAAYTSRGDVGTLTGRTDIWDFAISKIKQRPFLGYGYATSGAIFLSRYFPLWWGPWDMGPHTSLHNGYLSHAIGVGIPATLLWLYIALRPWIFLFRHPGDPWRLKSIFLLVIIPILICNFTEELLGDFVGDVGLLFGLGWALGEHYRLRVLQQASTERAATLARLPAAVIALASAR